MELLVGYATYVQTSSRNLALMQQMLSYIPDPQVTSF